jgi:hypothetical protein
MRVLPASPALPEESTSAVGPSIVLRWLGEQIADDPEALAAAKHTLFEVRADTVGSHSQQIKRAPVNMTFSNLRALDPQVFIFYVLVTIGFAGLIVMYRSTRR